jgi:hypothetical protein
MNAILLLDKISTHPVLQYFTLDGICTLTRLAGHLKKDILQPQSILQSNPNVPPLHLPGPILAFLASSLGIPLDAMHDCWDIMKEHMWWMPITP